MEEGERRTGWRLFSIALPAFACLLVVALLCIALLDTGGDSPPASDPAQALPLRDRAALDRGSSRGDPVDVHRQSASSSPAESGSSSPEDSRGYLTPDGVCLRGRVLDAEGHPVAAAEVELRSDSPSASVLGFWSALGEPPHRGLPTTTDDAGCFSFERLRRQDYLIRAGRESLGCTFRTVLADELELPVELVLEPAHSLEVLLRDGKGRPLKDVTLGLRREYEPRAPIRHATTNGDGLALFSGLPAGRYPLGILGRHGAYLELRQWIEIPARSRVEIELTALAAIQGVVRNESGEAVAGAEIAFLVSGGSLQGFARTRSGENGAYRIEGLPPGPVQPFTVTHPDYATHFVLWSEGLRGAPKVGTLDSSEVLNYDIVLKAGTVLEGAVLDARTNETISGAEVRVAELPLWFWRGPRTCTSDGEGHYRITGLMSGEVALDASAPAYWSPDIQALIETTAAAGESVRIPPGFEVLIPMDVAVVQHDLRLQRSAHLSGVIRDAQDRPVPGARVSFLEGEEERGHPLSTSCSDARGEFSLASMPPDRKGHLQVVKKGYPPARSEPLVLASGETRKGFVVLLESGGTVRGKVFDPDGVPIRGATVTLRNQERFSDGTKTSSDVEGEFTFRALPHATWWLRVECEGYLPLERTAISNDDPPLELLMERSTTISGRVVDEGGEGIEGAKVIARQEGIRADATTDEEGSFLLRGLGNATCTLEVLPDAERAHGFIPLHREGIAGGARDLVLEVRQGLTIAGRVLAPDGKPAAGVSLRALSRTIPGYETSATSGEDGGIALRGLEPGSYCIHVVGCSDRKLKPAWTTWEDVPAGSQDLAFQLERGARIEGTVSGPDGLPRAGWTVHAIDSSSFSKLRRSSYWSRGGGQFRITGLVPGRVYELHAESRWKRKPIRVGEALAGSTGVQLTVPD